MTSASWAEPYYDPCHIPRLSATGEVLYFYRDTSRCSAFGSNASGGREAPSKPEASTPTPAPAPTPKPDWGRPRPHDHSEPDDHGGIPHEPDDPRYH